MAVASWAPPTVIGRTATDEWTTLSTVQIDGALIATWSEGRVVHARIGAARRVAILGTLDIGAGGPIVAASGGGAVVAFASGSTLQLRRLRRPAASWLSSAVPLGGPPGALSLVGNPGAVAAGSLVVRGRSLGLSVPAPPRPANLQPLAPLGDYLLGTGLRGPRALALVTQRDSRGIRVDAALATNGRFTTTAPAVRVAPSEVVTGVAAVVRSAGGPVALVIARDDSGGTRLLAASGTASNTWGDPTTVAAPSRPILGAQHPSVAARYTGNLVAAWRESAPGGKVVLMAAREGLGQRAWTRPVRLAGPARLIGSPALATSPDGRTLVAYSIAGRIHVRQLDGRSNARVWSRAVRITPSGTACAMPRLSFAPDGRATVAYVCGTRINARTERAPVAR